MSETLDEVAEKQCEHCPFRPDNDCPEEIRAAFRQMAHTQPLVCHETYMVDIKARNGIRRPCSEWRRCRGSVNYLKRTNDSR